MRIAADTKNATIARLGRRVFDAKAGPAVDFRLGEDRKLGCSNSAVPPPPPPLRSASYVSFPSGSFARADRPPSVT
jgi:hypothetical protein